MQLDLIYSLTAMMLNRMLGSSGCATAGLRGNINNAMVRAMGHISTAERFGLDLCRVGGYDCGSPEDYAGVRESLVNARIDFEDAVFHYSQFIGQNVTKPYNCPVIPTACDCTRIAGLYAEINSIKSGPYDNQFDDFSRGNGDCLTLAKSLRQLVIDMICDVDALLAIYGACQYSCTSSTPYTSCTSFITATRTATAAITTTTTVATTTPIFTTATVSFSSTVSLTTTRTASITNTQTTSTTKEVITTATIDVSTTTTIGVSTTATVSTTTTIATTTPIFTTTSIPLTTTEALTQTSTTTVAKTTTIGTTTPAFTTETISLTSTTTLGVSTTTTSAILTTSTIEVFTTSSTCPVCPQITVTETQSSTVTTCTCSACFCCRPTNADGLVVRSNPVANSVSRLLRRSQTNSKAVSVEGQLHEKGPLHRMVMPREC